MIILEKIRNFVLGDGYDEDDGYYEEYDEEYIDELPNERPRFKEELNYFPSPRSKKPSHDSNVVNLPSTNHNTEMRAKIVMCRPEMVDSATSICDHLKNDIICVVNLEGVDKANAQRIADFLGGACYALNGEIQRISNDIFLIAPVHIGISSELKEELKSSGSIFPWVSGAFR